MKSRQSSKCPRKFVAGRRQNSRSPKCRLMRWTRCPRAISARPSRSKKLEIGPCRNRNERGCGGLARCARCRIGVASVPVHVYARSKAEIGPQGTPALAAEPEPGEQVDRFPIEDRFAQTERRDRPRVEPGPGEERVAAAHCPDLDAGGRPRARAARMKPERVGDDERVGRNRDRPRRRQAERGKRFGRDRAHQPVRVLRRPAAGRDRHPPLPIEPLRRQTVRSRHVDERHRVRRDIVQEQPRLDGRVKRVGMQIGLRVGRSGMSAAEDRLQIDHRHRRRRSGIADQIAVFRQFEQVPRGRHAVEHATDRARYAG